MKFDKIIEELEYLAADYDEDYSTHKALIAAVARLRSDEKRLKAAEKLATNCNKLLSLSNRMLDYPCTTHGYSEWDDVNMILDLGLQAYYNYAGKEQK